MIKTYRYYVTYKYDNGFGYMNITSNKLINSFDGVEAIRQSILSDRPTLKNIIIWDWKLLNEN